MSVESKPALSASCRGITSSACADGMGAYCWNKVDQSSKQDHSSKPHTPTKTTPPQPHTLAKAAMMSCSLPMICLADSRRWRDT